MFQAEVQKRLALLEKGLVECSAIQLHLKEKKEDGAADLTLNLENPCILFRDLEKRKLAYFKNKKCADYVLYEQKGEEWIVHIFELKKSVGEATWKEMKEQFAGAMQNALAIAGFLGIHVEVDRMRIYSVYRNDKINRYADPVKMRFQMHLKGNERMREVCVDWNAKEVELQFLGSHSFKHRKIQLNIETGKGICALP